MCYIPLSPDPDPDRLFIYLHARRYKTSYGDFETGMPVWAREGWDGDDTWEGRAKGQGKGGAVEKAGSEKGEEERQQQPAAEVEFEEERRVDNLI